MSTRCPAHPVETARSLLFVPADRPQRLPKALASGADAVIVDLEDAVAPAARPAARVALQAAWNALAPQERERVAVRINGVGTADHADDVALARQLAGAGLECLVVAKAEAPEGLAALASALPHGARFPGVSLVPLIESAEGAARLEAIAAVPGVVRLAFGHLDLQADLGMACGPDEAELAPLRWALVLASRRAGLPPPVDGVTTDLANADRLAADTARARRFGFGAKLCIHPSQVAGVHAALAPTPAERAWAHRVLRAEAESKGGACTVDGKMVDAPVIALAQRLLRAAAPPP